MTALKLDGPYPPGALTAAEVAAELGVARPTARRLMKQHGVRTYRNPLDNRHLLHNLEDVNRVKGLRRKRESRERIVFGGAGQEAHAIKAEQRARSNTWTHLTKLGMEIISWKHLYALGIGDDSVPLAHGVVKLSEVGTSRVAHTVAIPEFDGYRMFFASPGADDSVTTDSMTSMHQAQRLGIRVFVIDPLAATETGFDVWMANIESYDSELGCFKIVAEGEPLSEHALTQDEPLGDLHDGGVRQRQAKRAERVDQEKFRWSVFRRYGLQCAICDVTHPELLDGAHIVEKGRGQNGSDHPLNGLPLCATHNRAFDRYLFGIHPGTKHLHFRDSGTDQSGAQIITDSILHLRNQPARAALEERWDEWERRTHSRK
jgi:hypothetical protein